MNTTPNMAMRESKFEVNGLKVEVAGNKNVKSFYTKPKP